MLSLVAAQAKELDATKTSDDDQAGPRATWPTRHPTFPFFQISQFASSTDKGPRGIVLDPHPEVSR